MPDINTLARWAAANAETDRDMLALCMEAAQLYLENAGVRRMTGNALYDLAVLQLAVHYFDNKGVLAEGGTAQIPMGVNSIMHQLRLEDPETVTDGGGTAGGSGETDGDGDGA